jgi:hypothetical protein
MRGLWERSCRRRRIGRVMGIALMLAVGHNASNGRFREAFAAFIKDRSWPILPFPNADQLGPRPTLSG